MIFMDYSFDVLDNGTILMDRSLTLEQLKTENKTEYVLVLVDNRIVFVKKP